MLACPRDCVDHDLRKRIEEALHSPEWYRAMNTDYESLQKIEVWELVKMLEKNLPNR